jgi:hypothetical protein
VHPSKWKFCRIGCRRAGVGAAVVDAVSFGKAHIFARALPHIPAAIRALPIRVLPLAQVGITLAAPDPCKPGFHADTLSQYVSSRSRGDLDRRRTCARLSSGLVGHHRRHRKRDILASGMNVCPVLDIGALYIQ